MVSVLVHCRARRFPSVGPEPAEHILIVFFGTRKSIGIANGGNRRQAAPSHTTLFYGFVAKRRSWRWTWLPARGSRRGSRSPTRVPQRHVPAAAGGRRAWTSAAFVRECSPKRRRTRVGRTEISAVRPTRNRRPERDVVQRKAVGTRLIIVILCFIF